MARDALALHNGIISHARMSFVDVPVKVWQDDDAWYAEAVTIPQAHVCGDSRADVLEAIRNVLADLKELGLLAESAELARVPA